MASNVAVHIITEADLLEREILDGFPREVINGVWAEEGKMAGWKHGRIVTKLSAILEVYCSQSKVGEVVGDGVHFILKGSPNCVTDARIPDLAFVGTEKLATIEDEHAVVHFAPDIAIEVVSPTEGARSIHEKMGCYIEAGTLEFWVIYPQKQVLVVHLADGTAFTYSTDDLLTSSLLPNFELPIANIFK